jgi:hypothetical protein
MHITITVKKKLVDKQERKKEKKEKENTRAEIKTNARACGFNAGLLARSQFAAGSSCDRPT